MELSVSLIFGSLMFCLLLSEKGTVLSNTMFPTAVNITWSSINFKTILEWQPKPTNYSYTVEISGKLTDWKKNPSCILTKSTECDLTRLLENVNDTYFAHVISEVERTNEDVEEFPYATSPSFIPYKHTIIGQPHFTLVENETKTKVKVIIKDPETPYRNNNNTFKSIREYLNGDLEYRVYYWKAASSGKKSASTKINEIEIAVDKGESYCFSVQAVIPSRAENRLGHSTPPQCTHSAGDFLNDYGPVLLIALLIVVVVIIITAVVLCVLCKRRKKTEKEVENMPLKNV